MPAARQDRRPSIHTHPGAEAIYVLNGEVTQRTGHGVEMATAGKALNAHAPEMVMQLQSTGSADLSQLVMFVVDADRPFSPVASF
jgi:quercetin dioxygenase-like cupin family protein